MIENTLQELPLTVIKTTYNEPIDAKSRCKIKIEE